MCFYGQGQRTASCGSLHRRPLVPEAVAAVQQKVGGVEGVAEGGVEGVAAVQQQEGIGKSLLLLL